jgi:hypothetical protein
MKLGLFRTIFDSLGEIVAGLDELVTSDEERDKIRAEMESVRLALAARVLEMEAELVQRRASIIEAEAKGESWIQRSWRPVTMLTFLVLVVMHHLGLLEIAITQDMWDLLQVGIGGYVISRGIEKTAPAIVRTLQQDPRESQQDRP